MPYEWVTELISWASLVGILVLMAIRQRQHPRTLERRSRFYGSTFWQAYYVELTILGVVLCILTLRGLEYALARTTGEGHGGALHFPLTFFIGTAFTGLSVGALEAAIVVVAALKILISMAWLVTISLQPTMGVAWHRFLAFFNIYLKRHADGRTSLGALQPIAVGARRSTSRTSRTSTRTPRSAPARSRTSPGRACWTSPPAPSAAAASRSARPGTPRSRCRPRCW